MNSDLKMSVSLKDELVMKAHLWSKLSEERKCERHYTTLEAYLFIRK